KADDTLSFDVSFRASGWSKSAGSFPASIKLNDGSTNEPIGTLGATQVDLTKPGSRMTVRRPLGLLTNRGLKLKLEATLPMEDGLFTLTHVYSKPKPEQEEMAAPLVQTSSEESTEELLTAYPNPFNPETKIGYRIKESGMVKLAVFDLLGREVTVLADGQKPACIYSATWNAAGLPSGTYICRLSVQETGGKSVVKAVKMQYVR
ncbi:MAG: T9SS type A sorting domain-containing protein, partial [Bacteroidota bacterium]